MKRQIVILFSITQLLVSELSEAKAAASTGIGKPPRFRVRMMSSFLKENNEVGKRFYRLAATGHVQSYYFEPMNKRDNEKGDIISTPSLLADAFVLDDTSGIISLNKSLDFESFGLPPSQHYLMEYFHAIAEGGTPLRNVTVPFIVIILDVNDNPPVFSPNTPKYITLVNNASNGTEVTKIVATDADHGPNGLVTYTMHVRIGHNNSSLAFRIDPYTGQIYVNTPLVSKNVEDQYDLQIIVQDGAQPAQRQQKAQMDLILFVRQPGRVFACGKVLCRKEREDCDDEFGKCECNPNYITWRTPCDFALNLN